MVYLGVVHEREACATSWVLGLGPGPRGTIGRYHWWTLNNTNNNSVLGFTVLGYRYYFFSAVTVFMGASPSS